jgi:hypothetical protein
LLSSDDVVGVDPVALAKFDAGLRRTVAEARGDPERVWPVLVVLGGGGRVPAAEVSAERWQADFERDSAELIAQLLAHGARDVTPLWLSRAMGATVGLEGLNAVGRRPEVRQIVLNVARNALIAPNDKEEGR